MGRPLFSHAYSTPAVRVEPEQPQPYEKWSYWRQFDPDSEDFFADAEEERICTPEPDVILDGVIRGASPVADEVDSSSSSASSSGRGTPTLEEDGLSVEEAELEFRRRVRDVVVGSPVNDDGQTYRAVARPNTSYIRTSFQIERSSRSPSPQPTRRSMLTPIPRAQVVPESVTPSPIPATTRSDPIPIPARPTTPQNNALSYSFGSPSPPPSVTPRLYTWARSTTLPSVASPSSPLPNRSARRSFANIAASPSTTRVIF